VAKKDAFSTSPSTSFINHGRRRNRAGTSSRPTPEDGHRLIHAFMEIKQVALREAIIQFVTELSKLPEDVE
jgi:hypothetical protein